MIIKRFIRNVCVYIFAQLNKKDLRKQMESVNTSGKTALDFTRDIEQFGRIIAEYIWIDGDLGIRTKTRTLPAKITALE